MPAAPAARTRRHVFSCPVRWSDMDAYGHVNNARFLTYLEDARIDLLFTKANAEGVAGLAGGVLVKHQEIEYVRPVEFGDPLRIELWIRDIRAASFTVDYLASVRDRVVATASTVLVTYDLGARALRRLDAEERDFLERHRS